MISGFLITSILMTDIAGGHYSIANFYEKRARRILPALFVMLATCLPFAWAWMLPDQWHDFAQSLTGVSLFASNIVFWQGSDYFAASSEYMPLLHTWSLAVEEQYYLFFPIFLAALWPLGPRRLLWLIAACAFASLLLSEWAWRHLPSANFYLAPTRVWELFAGSIAAIIVRNRGPRAHQGLAMAGADRRGRITVPVRRDGAVPQRLCPPADRRGDGDPDLGDGRNLGRAHPRQPAVHIDRADQLQRILVAPAAADVRAHPHAGPAACRADADAGAGLARPWVPELALCRAALSRLVQPVRSARHLHPQPCRVGAVPRDRPVG
ncbi:acyltransferase family protein [Novosphingobium colocasiae]